MMLVTLTYWAALSTSLEPPAPMPASDVREAIVAASAVGITPGVLLMSGGSASAGESLLSDLADSNAMQRLAQACRAIEPDSAARGGTTGSRVSREMQVRQRRSAARTIFLQLRAETLAVLPTVAPDLVPRVAATEAAARTGLPLGLATVCTDPKSRARVGRAIIAERRAWRLGRAMSSAHARELLAARASPGVVSAQRQAEASVAAFVRVFGEAQCRE